MRKKITSLFALFLLVAGTAVAQISSLSETSNTKCYTITNSRSSWAVAAGGTQLTTIAKLGLAFSSTDTRQLFALITPDEGANYYLWSVSGNGYVTPSGTLTTDVGACKPVYLNSSKVMYFDSTHYINTGGSNQITIDNWSTADAGNILTIAEAADFDPTAALEVFATPTCNVTYVISDANGVVYTSPVETMAVGAEVTTVPTEYQRAFCTYTVTPTTLVAGHNTVPVTVTYSLPFTVSASYDDATWYFAKIRNTKYIKMTSTEPYSLDTTKDTEDTGKWAFVGNPYAGFSILNKAAGATKVLTKDGSKAVMRSESTETWDLVANGAGFNLLRHGSAQDYINDNNNKLGFWVSALGATDVGGQWLIEQAPDETVVTYVISDANGVVYTSPAVTMAVGAEVTTLPSEYQRTYCTYTVTPTTLVAGDNTVPVTVTYSLPFTVSASYDDATWYFAKIRSNRWISMDSTEPYYPSATKNMEDNGKWAFVGNPYAGFSILNKAAGATMVLTKDGSNAVMRSESTETWDLVPNGSGFNLLRHGSAYDYMTQYGGTTGYLGFWVSTLGATDGGGQWLIEQAPDETVHVTYNVVLNGTFIATATEAQGVGAAPAVPSSLEFAYTTYTYDVTELTATTTTVVATPTFNTPYTLSTSYDDATWYYMRGHASTGNYPNRYISTNEDAIVWADGNAMSDAYKWALVGNPIQGVQLVNKATGATKCAQGTDPVTMGTDAKLWTLKEQTNYTDATNGKGFGLYDASLPHGYVNCQGGTLKCWVYFDQGSTFWFEEVPTVTVTYNVVLGGTVVASATETQGVGFAPAVPSSLEFAYTTYTYDVTELTATTTTVVATPTFNTPYTLSTSYDDATWYYMRGHASTDYYPNRYISTNEDAIVWADGNAMTDAYKWALVGNPIQGVKLVNKAAGATKCAQGTNPVAMGTDAKLWTLKEQTNYTDATGGKGFGLYGASLNYINCQNGTLKYWAGFDQGSTFWFEEIPSTPYYDALVAVVEPYVTAAESHAGEYFQLAASGEAITNFMSTMVVASQNAANNVDMTEAEYNAALGYFNDALVMPETGYYRLKSRMVDEGSTGYGYVGVNSSATLVGNIADPTADASTVFYVKKNSAGYYSFSSQGLYGNVASQSTPVVADATEHDFILAIAAPGYAYIKTLSNVDRSCYHVAASQSYQVVGWGSGAYASQFVFEPATDVTVNMNVVGDASYATAVFPFPVEVSGAKVMRVEANIAAGKAKYYETANTIPAGMPVMLVDEDGAATATATIIDSADELTEQNDLVGHYLAGNVTDALVLGASSGVIGFYKLSATGTLGANRAYIDNSTSSDVRALVLAAGETTDETTGITGVATEAAQNGEVYDLSGRRVQNVQNGLYIINGKKVLVK